MACPPPALGANRGRPPSLVASPPKVKYCLHTPPSRSSPVWYPPACHQEQPIDARLVSCVSDPFPSSVLSDPCLHCYPLDDSLPIPSEPICLGQGKRRG